MSAAAREPDAVEPGREPAPVARIRLPDQLAARFLGVALALASCNVSAAVHRTLGVQVLVAAVAVAAWWAAPMTDERPVQNSLRWYRIAARRRSTVLAVGAVALAAITDPPTWLAACVTGLFVAYLLITDEWTRGSTAPSGSRDTGPALTAAAAAALAFLAACVPMGSTDWARLPAALALAATVTCLALALRGRRAPG
jgi:hypothetical protein